MQKIGKAFDMNAFDFTRMVDPMLKLLNMPEDLSISKMVKDPKTEMAYGFLHPSCLHPFDDNPVYHKSNRSVYLLNIVDSIISCHRMLDVV